MPIQTGYLRASLQGFVGNGLPALSDKPSGDGTFSFDTNQITLVIANAKLSDTITMAYGARYASHVEYGARGRPGRRFVALASQQWPRIVSEVSAEAQARNS